MKRTLKIIVSLTVMLSSLGWKCMADELIRINSTDNSHNASIIRHYSLGKDVVCINSDRPYFIMLEEGNPSAYALYVDLDIVYDVQIENDTVYFCGKKASLATGGGVVGYFDVASLFTMSYANVTYLHLHNITSVSALKVGFYSNRRHVAAIGTDAPLRTSKVVDLVKDIVSWSIYYGTLDNNDMVFYDLEITENYIVITSQVSPNRKARLWFFVKPTAAGAPLFSGNNYYYDIEYPFVGKYLVKHRRRDEFVTAYMSNQDPEKGTYLCLSFYNGIYHPDIMFSMVSHPNLSLMDIAVGPTLNQTVGDEVSVLLNGSFSPVSRSEIIGYPYGVFTFYSTYGHIHYDVFLSSLDVADGLHVVASGNNSLSGIPTFDKMNKGVNYGNCLVTIPTSLWYSGIEHRLHTAEVGSCGFSQTSQVIAADRKEMQIETICISTNSTDEEETEKEDE